MNEKTRKILIVVLAVLLAVSIFFNGWFLHERLTASKTPENDDLTSGIIDTYQNFAQDFDDAVNDMIKDSQGGAPNNSFICEGECGSKHPH